MNVPLPSDALHELLASAVVPAALQAFEQQLERCRPHWQLHHVLATFTSAARTLGRSPIRAPSAAACTVLESALLVDLSTDVAGRALLLCALAEAAPHKLEDAVTIAYEDGDTLEKLAIVRCLALLPQAERFTRLALDAGRSNDLDLLRALACHNPFPAQHYDDRAWNKLFMKAAFVELPLAEIIAARERDNPELSRMALQYIEQQESALRSFPAELWLAVAAFPPPGAVAKLLGYASHAVVEQRLATVRALTRVRQTRTASFLRERVSVETDARVHGELTRALQALTPDDIADCHHLSPSAAFEIPRD